MGDKKTGVFLGHLTSEENIEIKNAQVKIGNDLFYGEIPSIRKMVLVLIRNYLGR